MFPAAQPFEQVTQYRGPRVGSGGPVRAYSSSVGSSRRRLPVSDQTAVHSTRASGSSGSGMNRPLPVARFRATRSRYCRSLKFITSCGWMASGASSLKVPAMVASPPWRSNE